MASPATPRRNLRAPRDQHRARHSRLIAYPAAIFPRILAVRFDQTVSSVKLLYDFAYVEVAESQLAEEFGVGINRMPIILVDRGSPQSATTGHAAPAEPDEEAWPSVALNSNQHAEDHRMQI